ncbi:hypothetical protein PRIPAC_78468 [Pristionchus pacificus]|uniref:glucuronosyltransferase n=1 Tax=Pristionchus pacificus TaxID=54126 RepID=A0A2A6CMA9_PRIPA|nr:hypothetical protein PRIPAC_78468 [Pristionchus pacificus]|eukprot:PDM79193.1 Glycosyltransferase [Pristionchus pacificus]
MRLPLLLVIFALQTSALKFLAYNPRIGTSHFTFVSSVVEALVDAGHEVVMLAPSLTEQVKIVETNGARIIKDFVVSERGKELADQAMIRATDLFWAYKSDLDFAEILNLINQAAAEQCNATLHTPGLIERLKAEKFDAAFAEPIDLCGMGTCFGNIGIFHLVGIKKFAIVLSVTTTEGTYAITGAPTVPSYVPGSMADFGDRMTFPQRVLNTLTLGVLYHVFGSIRGLYQDVFDPLYPGMPTFYDIMLNSSLIFPNCEPLTDFPRPTSHKIVEIGGISVAGGKDVLDEKWSSILGLRPNTVLLSFGSAAQANRMPEAYKKAIRGMVVSLPEVTFIVKYEQPEDGFSSGLPNMIEAAWLPQRALLKDSRLSAFITHGGAGSTTEATHSGVPLIVVPLMGDQLRNSHLIERLGTGIKISKDSLNSASELTAAVKRIIEDKSFKKKAALVAAQLREAPFSPREKLVRNMEFMAKYGPLTMLDHYGTQLYTFQYYLIDVFAFLFVVLAVIIGNCYYEPAVSRTNQMHFVGMLVEMVDQ